MEPFNTPLPLRGARACISFTERVLLSSAETGNQRSAFQHRFTCITSYLLTSDAQRGLCPCHTQMLLHILLQLKVVFLENRISCFGALLSSAVQHLGKSWRRGCKRPDKTDCLEYAQSTMTIFCRSCKALFLISIH